MENRDWIELGVLVFTALVFGMTLFRMSVRTQNRINENSIRILSIEKELYEMKQRHDRELSDLKTEFAKMFTESRYENRQEHGKIFNKLDAVVVQLSEVATSLKIHVRGEKNG